MFAVTFSGAQAFDPSLAAISIGLMGAVYLLAQVPSRIRKLLAGLCCSLVLTGSGFLADKTQLWINGIWCCEWILEMFWICVGEWGPGC